MICLFCGKSSPDNHVYCLYCGATQIDIAPLYLEQKEHNSDLPPKTKENIYDLINKTEIEWVYQQNMIPSQESQDASFASEENSIHQKNIEKNEAGLSTGIEQDPHSIETSAAQHLQESGQYTSELSCQENHFPPIANEFKKYSQTQIDEDIIRSTLSGRYEIIKKLGVGGMASVYRARDIALNREVAVKVLPRAFLRDEQFIKRFKREAKLAALLEHPNIFKIYEINQEHGLCYFVMNYIPGGTLTEQMNMQESLSLDKVIKWSMDICSALSHAHELGIIHRDLKPDNIMIDKNNNAVVMDFGIAHAARGTSLTQTGAVLGTPQYMSPDQASGKELDTRSDIYSLGIMLYQMATGSLPFKATEPVSLMYMHVHETPESPDVRNPDVPRWLRDIIMKCLEKNPEDRFSSARELRFALAAQKSPVLQYARFVNKVKVDKQDSIRTIGRKVVRSVYSACAAFIIKISGVQKYNQKSVNQSLIKTMKPQSLKKIRPKTTVVFDNIVV